MSNFAGKGTTFLRHVQIIVKKSHRVSRLYWFIVYGL